MSKRLDYFLLFFYLAVILVLLKYLFQSTFYSNTFWQHFSFKVYFEFSWNKLNVFMTGEIPAQKKTTCVPNMFGSDKLWIHLKNTTPSDIVTKKITSALWNWI